MSESKRVIAVIPFELWSKAHLNNVSWSKAMRTGINVTLGITDKKNHIKEKINSLKAEIKIYEDQLKENNNVEEQKEKEKKDEKTREQEQKKFLKNNSKYIEFAYNKCKHIDSQTISDVYEYWEMFNRKHIEQFGSGFDQDEFMKLVEEMK